MKIVGRNKSQRIEDKDKDDGEKRTRRSEKMEEKETSRRRGSSISFRHDHIPFFQFGLPKYPQPHNKIQYKNTAQHHTPPTMLPHWHGSMHQGGTLEDFSLSRRASLSLWHMELHRIRVRLRQLPEQVESFPSAVIDTRVNTFVKTEQPT